MKNLEIEGKFLGIIGCNELCGLCEQRAEDIQNYILELEQKLAEAEKENKRWRVAAFEPGGAVERAIEFIEKAHYFDDYHNRERQSLIAELEALLGGKEKDGDIKKGGNDGLV